MWQIYVQVYADLEKKGLFVITSPLQYWLKFSYTQHLYIYTSKRWMVIWHLALTLKKSRQ